MDDMQQRLKETEDKLRTAQDEYQNELESSLIKLDEEQQQ